MNSTWSFPSPKRRIGHTTATYAEILCLPFALLADNTFLPFAVLILFRKPWTLALDLFFGWNVIFIFYTSFIKTHYATLNSSLYYIRKIQTSQVFSLWFSILKIHVIHEIKFYPQPVDYLWINRPFSVNYFLFFSGFRWFIHYLQRWLWLYTYPRPPFQGHISTVHIFAYPQIFSPISIFH